MVMFWLSDIDFCKVDKKSRVLILRKQPIPTDMIGPHDAYLVQFPFKIVFSWALKMWYIYNENKIYILYIMKIKYMWQLSLSHLLT